MNTLFTLEHCIKCSETKKYLVNKKYVEVILPNQYSDWTEEQEEEVNKYGILKQLLVTAPVLVTDEGQTIVGQLRIIRWANGVKGR
jgi:glutaredoxin